MNHPFGLSTLHSHSQLPIPFGHHYKYYGLIGTYSQTIRTVLYLESVLCRTLYSLIVSRTAAHDSYVKQINGRNFGGRRSRRPKQKREHKGRLIEDLCSMLDTLYSSHSIAPLQLASMEPRTQHRRHGGRLSLHHCQRYILLSLMCLTNFAVESGHVYSDSFPSSYEEYSYDILDPLTVYGSPYGGFSRATPSRLATLPLVLPEVLEETPSEDPFYMQVRDTQGRLFACRVYHEDELDPESLNDSMFDAPRLRVEIPEAGVVDKDTKETALTDSQGDAGFPGSASASGTTTISSEKSVASGNLPQTDSKKNSSFRAGDDTSLLIAIIERRLKTLEGICAQIHKGWWSYEWCYQQEVSQFHIELGADSPLGISISDISTLGKYDSRSMYTSLENMRPNNLAEDTPELGRVVDVYRKGDICEETNEPRKTKVNFQCCSDRMMLRRKGLLKKDGKKFESDDIAVMDIKEDPDQVCHYDVTVCTTLLCDEEDMETSPQKKPAANTLQGLLDTATRHLERAAAGGEPKENESIREILQGNLANTCLQSFAGGWWSYELCSFHDVRQYHEIAVASKTKSGGIVTTKKIETEHVLGRYKTDIFAHVPDDEEWRLVVNSTEGDGAYVEIEYTDGDICDHPDVTDSAIVAGGAGAGGVARSSSIRYYCSDRYALTMKEDSTCHYIVDVKVPALCNHPLFKTPVAKKQQIKCLPAEDQ